MVRGAIAQVMDDLVKTQSEPAGGGIADSKSQHAIDAQSGLSSQRLALLFHHLPGAILTNLAALCLIFVILWPISPKSLLIAWSAVLSLITLGRGVCLYFWKKLPSSATEPSSYWLVLFSAGTLASGLAWHLLKPFTAYRCLVKRPCALG